jgi:hypothetical protein
MCFAFSYPEFLKASLNKLASVVSVIFAIDDPIDLILGPGKISKYSACHTSVLREAWPA